ncbi:MAG TPA: hypothetical protein DCZ10_03515 [Pelotomaculum sp.]|nr:hypothetical protein [Pelotomaculum sp.]
MRFFILTYNGLIWGLLAAVMVTRNLWLDMRISVGLIIPAVILITIIVGFIAKNKLRTASGFTLANLISCFILTYLVLGTIRLAVVPASIIRETINMTSLRFSVVNWFLIIVLTLGLMIIWAGERKSKYKY